MAWRQGPVPCTLGTGSLATQGKGLLNLGKGHLHPIEGQEASRQETDKEAGKTR